MANAFGGQNETFLYNPLSEDEQEVLGRLISTQDLKLIMRGWGRVINPVATFGESRLNIGIDLTLNAPAMHVPVWYLDLELWTISTDTILYKERMSAMVNDKPLYLGAGSRLAFNWAIWVKKIDPRVVKAHKPGAMGLTSKLDGKWHLSEKQKNLMGLLRQGEANIHQDSKRKARVAANREKAAISRGEIKMAGKLNPDD